MLPFHNQNIVLFSYWLVDWFTNPLRVADGVGNWQVDACVHAYIRIYVEYKKEVADPMHAIRYISRHPLVN